MKCTHELFCLNLVDVERDPKLKTAFFRHFGLRSQVYVKSSDLLTKYSFFHLIRCNVTRAVSALRAV